MSTFNYIELGAPSNGYPMKRYYIVRLRRPYDKKVNLRRTIRGMDVQAGNTYTMYEMKAKVPYATANTSDGSLDDLVRLYAFNGTVTMTDWYGQTFNVIFYGTLEEDPVTTIIEGTEAYAIVGMRLMKTTPVT